MKRLVIALLVTAIAGWAQSGADDSAVLRVYRPKRMVGFALKPSIYCDGVELARLRNGMFFVSDIRPGKRMITAGRSEVGLLIDFHPGGQYYLRLDHKNWAGTAVSGRQPLYLTQVLAEEAESEMKTLGVQDTKHHRPIRTQP